MAADARVSEDDLRAFVGRALRATGMRSADAEMVADGMVWADLRGIDPHGVAKLPLCVARFQAGGSQPDAEPTVVEESGTTAVLDACGAWGQVAGARAMAIAVDKAGRERLGAVVVRDSSSLGALGYYPLIAVRRGQIGLMITNSMPLLAPWGGAARLLGNQAYAIGCPAGRHPPLLLDTSNSATTWGHVKGVLERGESLPAGLALDRDGRPTVDPAAALEALLQPVGGHKGSGLALMWEVLTGVLAGLAFGPRVGSPETIGQRQQVSHFALAIDPSAFLPRDQFTERVDSLIDQVRSVPPAPGFERVYAPGERGFLLTAERTRTGIPLPEHRLAELCALADHLGVDRPRRSTTIRAAG